MWSDGIQILKTLIKPKAIAEKLEDIEIDELVLRGTQALLLDVDDTLASVDSYQVSLQKVQWIEKVKSMGIMVFVLSNNSSHRRIQKIAAQIGAKGLYFAMKPLPFSALELLADHGLNPKNTVVIGDKLFNDMILGNWIGAYPILVDPLTKKESLIKTLQREIEFKLLAWLS